jgi:hypothetical protein
MVAPATLLRSLSPSSRGAAAAARSWCVRPRVRRSAPPVDVRAEEGRLRAQSPRWRRTLDELVGRRRSSSAAAAAAAASVASRTTVSSTGCRDADTTPERGPRTSRWGEDTWMPGPAEDRERCRRAECTRSISMTENRPDKPLSGAASGVRLSAISFQCLCMKDNTIRSSAWFAVVADASFECQRGLSSRVKNRSARWHLSALCGTVASLSACVSGVT